MSLPLLLALVLVGWFGWKTTRRPAMPVVEARRLLEVSEDATPEAIGEAHRRLIARVHPDAGGSAELARRVNAARDVLLAERRKL